MADFEALFAQLSLAPDFEAPELFAYDASDRLLLHALAEQPDATAPGALVTIGDRYGALTLGALTQLGSREVRVYQDPLLGELALDANAARLGVSDYTHHALDEQLLRGATTVLMQLPRSLSELDELAQAIARWAEPTVTVFAGGRVKHMTRSMNEVLKRSFARLEVGLARQKSRILTVRQPLPAAALGVSRFPVWGADPDLDFALAAYGATFGGATLDHGSRLLLQTLRDASPRPPRRIVDLGCGNGVLAVSAARQFADSEVLASDQSRAAVAATTLTVARAGAGDQVTVHRADGTTAVPDAWAELVLLNPPFHIGAAVHMGAAQRLIAQCARVLTPGGELRIVYNSHLRYRALVEQRIGPVRQLARNRTFTVLSAARR